MIRVQWTLDESGRESWPVVLERLTSLSGKLRWLGLTRPGRGALSPAALPALPRLRELDLEVGDLSGLSKLAVLHVGLSAIKGSGLSHLSGLTELRELGLQATEVDDAGLAHRSKLGKLRRPDQGAESSRSLR